MFTGQIALFDATVVSQIIQKDFKMCRISVKTEDVVTRTERTVWTEHEGKLLVSNLTPPILRIIMFSWQSCKYCRYVSISSVAGVSMTFRA